VDKADRLNLSWLD